MRRDVDAAPRLSAIPEQDLCGITPQLLAKYFILAVMRAKAGIYLISSHEFLAHVRMTPERMVPLFPDEPFGTEGSSSSPRSPIIPGLPQPRTLVQI